MILYFFLTKRKKKYYKSINHAIKMLHCMYKHLYATSFIKIEITRRPIIVPLLV